MTLIIFVFSYTSSRTSLEPSECGEDMGSVVGATVITIPGSTKPTTNISVSNSACHVSLITNQFEENCDSTYTERSSCSQQLLPPPPSLLPPVVQQRSQVVSDHDSVGMIQFYTSAGILLNFFFIFFLHVITEHNEVRSVLLWVLVIVHVSFSDTENLSWFAATMHCRFLSLIWNKLSKIRSSGSFWRLFEEIHFWAIPISYFSFSKRRSREN